MVDVINKWRCGGCGKIHDSYVSVDNCHSHKQIWTCGKCENRFENKEAAESCCQEA